MNERVTPDGRYFVVRGRLWRRANPNVPAEKREALVRELMAAQRAVKAALASGNPGELALARKAVDVAKIATRRARPGLVDGRRARSESSQGEWQRLRGVVGLGREALTSAL